MGLAAWHSVSRMPALTSEQLSMMLRYTGGWQARLTCSSLLFETARVVLQTRYLLPYLARVFPLQRYQAVNHMQQ